MAGSTAGIDDSNGGPSKSTVSVCYSIPRHDGRTYRIPLEEAHARLSWLKCHLERQRQKQYPYFNKRVCQQTTKLHKYIHELTLFFSRRFRGCQSGDRTRYSSDRAL